MARLIKGLAFDGQVRVLAIDSTDIVAKALELHGLSPTATGALGRFLTAGSLMGAMLKNDTDKLTLLMKGDGPLGNMVVCSDKTGVVKGYAQNPDVDIPLNKLGKLDVGGAVGRGMMTIIKDIGLKEPYSGMIPIVSGEIAEDIAAYFASSEQIPTVCGLGVLVNPDLSIKRAGGYLIQLLPGATEEEITMLENNLKNVPSITKFFEQGKDVYDVINTLLEGFNPNVLDEDTVQYHCDCNRDRVEKALISIGIKDLQEIYDEEDQIEMGCQYCDKKYRFTKNDIGKMIKKLSK
jgi:molecular chaperone Hsp33